MAEDLKNDDVTLYPHAGERLGLGRWIWLGLLAMTTAFTGMVCSIFIMMWVYFGSGVAICPDYGCPPPLSVTDKLEHWALVLLVPLVMGYLTLLFGLGYDLHYFRRARQVFLIVLLFPIAPFVGWAVAGAVFLLHRSFGWWVIVLEPLVICCLLAGWLLLIARGISPPHEETSAEFSRAP